MNSGTIRFNRRPESRILSPPGRRNESSNKSEFPIFNAILSSHTPTTPRCQTDLPPGWPVLGGFASRFDSSALFPALSLPCSLHLPPPDDFVSGRGSRKGQKHDQAVVFVDESGLSEPVSRNRKMRGFLNGESRALNCPALSGLLGGVPQLPLMVRSFALV
jgi:hypothetical protein